MSHVYHTRYDDTHYDGTYYDDTHYDDIHYDDTHCDDTHYDGTHYNDTHYEMSHVYPFVRHDPFIRAPWLFQTNESCHLYTPSSFCCKYDWVIPHIWMSQITRTNGSRHTNEWVISHI